MSIRKLFLFGGAFLLGICVFATEDLGQKIGSYAVKDGKKVWVPTNVDKFCQWGTPEDMADYLFWTEYTRRF